MARADVIGLDEVVQKLEVRRLKVRISPIGIGDQVSLRENYVPTNSKTVVKARNTIMEGGKVDGNR